MRIIIPLTADKEQGWQVLCLFYLTLKCLLPVYVDQTYVCVNMLLNDYIIFKWD